MAACVPSVGGQGSQEDLKTHFATREGVYRLLPLTDYTKASRSTVGGGGGNVPSRLSFVRVTESPTSSGLGRVQVDDLMCVNLHRELHVYRHDVNDKVYLAPFAMISVSFFFLMNRISVVILQFTGASSSIGVDLDEKVEEVTKLNAFPLHSLASKKWESLSLAA